MSFIVNLLEFIPDGTGKFLQITFLVFSFCFLAWVILSWKCPSWSRGKRIGVALLGGGGGILTLIMVVGLFGMMLR